MSTDPPNAKPLSPTAFAILRDAVNLAREEQIQSVKKLSARLKAHWPNHEADIHSALIRWARYEKLKGHPEDYAPEFNSSSR